MDSEDFTYFTATVFKLETNNQNFYPTWPVVTVPPGGKVAAATIEPKCHCGQPYLPRKPGTQPAGATEPRNGWLGRHLGTGVTTCNFAPRWNGKHRSSAKGGSRHWIRPMGRCLNYSATAVVSRVQSFPSIILLNRRLHSEGRVCGYFIPLSRKSGSHPKSLYLFPSHRKTENSPVLTHH